MTKLLGCGKINKAAAMPNVGLWRSWERVTASREGRGFSHTCHQEMPVVNILQSQSSGRFYVGAAEDADVRLSEHQRGQTRSTRNRGPWSIVYREQFDTLVEARRRERQLKSWKSHRAIQALITSRDGSV